MNDLYREFADTWRFKIVKAVDLRDAGAPIAIISEDHWQKCLFG